MAGTLIIYRRPMRPITGGYYKLHYGYYIRQEKTNIKNIQNKHRNPNNKD